MVNLEGKSSCNMLITTAERRGTQVKRTSMISPEWTRGSQASRGEIYKHNNRGAASAHMCQYQVIDPLQKLSLSKKTSFPEASPLSIELERSLKS